MSQNNDTTITLDIWLEKEKKLTCQIQTLRKALKQKHLCEICFWSEKSIALIPCGHTFCEDCTIRMMDKQTCAMCRADIFETIRIYI